MELIFSELWPSDRLGQAYFVATVVCFSFALPFAGALFAEIVVEWAEMLGFGKHDRR